MAVAPTAKVKPNKSKSLLARAPKKKAPVSRRSILVDEKYTGPEPDWADFAELTPEEINSRQHKMFYYYNYHYTMKDLRGGLIEWLKVQKEFKTTKEEISMIQRSRWVPMTMCSMVRAHTRKGMPFTEHNMAFIKSQIKETLEKFAAWNEDSDEDPVQKVDNKKTPYKPTIQDRLNDKFRDIVGDMEEWYDIVIKGGDHVPKAYEHLTAMNTPQAMVGRIRAVYQGYRDELAEAQAGTCPQLKEAYSRYTAKDYKRHYAFLDAVLSDMDRFAQVKKTTRKVRTKKPASKEKLIARLKFLKDSAQLKMVSISPVDIIGCTELWTYNVKTRKLGRYVAAADSKALTVKGTGLIGYDEKLSISKTLRKPDQQLAELMKSGKLQLRKFMDGIKTTPSLLNGRINADTLLLKVLQS
jgi:hypothetical protein